MEAWRFGFVDLPPACKFDPTDTDIVVHYLLPRALGLPNPHEHAVVDGDPCSCPPWEFMRRSGHADSDHAFFFAPPRAPGNKRAARVVSPGEDDGVGGKWDAQKSTESSVVLVRGDGPGTGGGAAGAEMTVKYRRCNLSYYHGVEPSTSGWVMHEYQVTAPPRLSGTVLSRIKVTDKGKQRFKHAGGGPHRQGVVPDPDQPGPSNYDEYVHGHDDDDDDDGNALGLSGGEQSEVVYLGDGNGGLMAEMAAYFVVDDGNSSLNDGSGYYQDQDDGSGSGSDYCFNIVGDHNDGSSEG